MMELCEPEIRMKEDGEVIPKPISDSRIVDFYKNKCLFITGATGFLGKLLIEKLLRVSDDIDTIYVLVRCKKGLDENTRMDKVFTDCLFGPLTKYKPKFQHKIVIVKGDVGLTDLGLSPEDREVIKTKVNVIYHIAATVRFDEKITIATAINVRGTRDILKLAKTCKNLQSLVYVSTAFSNVLQKNIDEIFYAPKLSADELIDLLETKDEADFIEMSESLVHPWPNTYAFTKAVAENAVEKYGRGLPICIFRPSIVAATYREPIRGWIDNVYGVTGVLVGAGTGLLRCFHCNKKLCAEIVPGDYVINGMIASSYQNTVKTPNDVNRVDIYNYVSSVEKRIDYETLMNLGEHYGMQTPSIKSVWYYSFTLIQNDLLFRLVVFMLHYVPAFFVDLYLTIVGKEPMMMKIYKKVDKFSTVLRYFTKQEWNFVNRNTQKLWENLSAVDKAVFPFSMKELDWHDYFKTNLFGLRIHLLKDDPSTLPQARKKFKRLYYAHQMIKVILIGVVIRLLYALITMVM